MPGPHCGKCASPLCGPGILMLGLASSEGLGHKLVLNQVRLTRRADKPVIHALTDE